ncbi:GNAT family N-acetyltransferase [Carbonactinospora thermoautotrophica]|uniref:GNAT family N-acetyltransferase n=1 Tax=Carbonactinospora thermoautotrophica TaxID=1469144 RepID=UPI000B280344|nr:GNAT family protein [Carbonactinospora thermoautotrophica]
MSGEVIGPGVGWPRGRLVRLRPATLDDDALLADWARARSEWNDFGLSYRSVAERLAEGPLLGERGGMLIVERLNDGRPVGDVSWHPVQYGPNAESRAWNFGIELIPQARGHGLGTEAQRLLIGWLFATTRVNRIEATTDSANLAEQRALEKAGLRREGVLRGAQYRRGEWRDVVLYAVTRADWS